MSKSVVIEETTLEVALKPDAEGRREPLPRMSGAVAGRLVGVSPDGMALVEYPSAHGSATMPARSCVELSNANVGRELLLLFDAGDPRQPIVVGLIGSPHAPGNPAVSADSQRQHLPLRELEIDGRKVTLNGSESVTLRCGASSIVLASDGTILIRGTYVQTRSSGVNRIQGGSVRIN